MCRMDAPPDDLRSCRSSWLPEGHHSRHEADKGLVFMANLFRPRRLLKLISRSLADRITAAGFRRPCQLGLLVNDEKYRLVISRRHVQLIQGTLGRSYLRCSRYDMAQLLLGHLDVHESIAAGRLVRIDSRRWRPNWRPPCSLVCRLWRPPWDDLPAA